MNPWELCKAIYKKNKLSGPLAVDVGTCISLNKWISFDSRYARHVKLLIPYLFYVEPLHYFYLLYFTIPQQFSVPFFNRVAKEKPTAPDKLIEKVQYVLGWTAREVEKSKDILDLVIMENEAHWKKELSVK